MTDSTDTPTIPAMIIPDEASGSEDQTVDQAAGQSDELPQENPPQQPFRVYAKGDVFVFHGTSSLALAILDVFGPTTDGIFYKIRLYSSVVESITVSDAELFGFIQQGNLERLSTLRDQMGAVGEKIILRDGDLFTRDGEVFLSILSNELLFIDDVGMHQNIVGCRFGDGVVAFRNSLWVKSQIYGTTDQFPASVFDANNTSDNNDKE